MKSKRLNINKGNKINKKGGEFMKRFLILAMVFGFSMAIASSAFAGIIETRHNLSSYRTGAPATSVSGGTVIYSINQDQLCVWCHTPHGGITGPNLVLWNKSLTTATYTTYGTTVGGTAQITSANVRNASKICLTCHDGTLAINIVLNAPGTGNYNANGQQFGNWQGTDTGNIIAASVARVGTDLSNDHPISILYSAPSTVSDNNPGSLRTTAYLPSGTTTWISRSATVLSIAGQLVDGYIECVSCHDPHTSTNALFLRGTTSGSKVCIVCHDK